MFYHKLNVGAMIQMQNRYISIQDAKKKELEAKAQESGSDKEDWKKIALQALEDKKNSEALSNKALEMLDSTSKRMQELESKLETLSSDKKVDETPKNTTK